MRPSSTALLGLMLLATVAGALDNPSLKPRHQLPRDQFLDLCDPAGVFVDHLRVKFRETSRVRLRDGAPVCLEGEDLSPVKAFLARHPELRLARRWTLSEEEVDAYVARGEELSGWDLADLNNWYSLEIHGDNHDPKGLLMELLALEQVEIGHYHPRPAEASCGPDVAPPTPNLSSLQGYRDPAPLGVDIDHAWSLDPVYGNGIPSYDIQDVEHAWCVGHEDINSTFTVYDTDATVGNHGLAVISIMAACDNGFGITGLVPEARFSGRSWQPDAGNIPDVSSTLLSTGAFLDPGEMYLIEIHAPGPSQGTTCPCNCGQFEFIAMEYWQDNFDVIQANSANGRICVEAAGNGSMDLDWAGYSGAFNRSVRDSGALLVGAGEPGMTHNPSCFTNHGSRVDFYGWGDGVYAAGYGEAFDQGGCTQDYTLFFSGTSSATPIVAGAAASLALIHRNKLGSFPTPASLRSRLSINGTDHGPADPHREIGVMPNLRGVLAPDLLPFTPAGWHGPLVPANISGGGLPAVLDPFPYPNYLRINWRNASLYGDVDASHVKLWRDDVLAANYTVPATAAGQFNGRNVSNVGMRGGRHYLRMALDPDELLVEAVETNNTFVESFCWNPVAVTDGLPAAFSRGPKKDPQGSVELAMDGFGNGGNFAGYWEVFGVMGATGSADYDLQMFNQAPTSTSGWTSPVATSQQSALTDFVGCNNNLVSDGDWVGVVNWNDSSDGYTVERQGSVYLGSPPAVQTLVASNSLAAGEILDVWEFNATAGSPVWLNFVVTGGSADISVMVYGPDEIYFTRNDAVWTLNSGGPGAGESGIFTPAAGGYHCIVACKGLVTDLAQHADYSFYWGAPTGDLTTVARAGWTAPVVARNSGGSVGVLPAVLNEGPSVGDAGVANIGAGSMPAGPNLAFHLDGPLVYSSGNFVALAPGYEGEISNRGIGTVKGGRHELGAVQDYLGEFQEQLPGGEGNNRHYAQYAWSPYILANLTPLSRSAAPNWRNADNPEGWSLPGFNQDGYRITASYWTGFAAMPTLATEQLNSWIYNDALTGSTTAFIGPEESNFPAPGKISIAMANGNMIGNGINRNVGVCNNFTYPTVVPSTPYTVQMAQRLQDLVTGSIANNTLAAGVGGGQLLHTFDVYMVAGQSYPVNLFNHSTINLGAAIFRAGVSYQGLDDAVAVFNANGPGGHESGEFTAAITGWHGVAVYRDGYLDLGPAAPYGIVVGIWRPAATIITTMVPVDFSDGNATVWVEFDPVTTDINGNPLVIDHYNLYYDDNPYMDSPGMVPTTSTAMYLYYGNVGMTQAGFLRVTAVDEDGVLVADSQPGRPLPDAAAIQVDPMDILMVPAAGAGASK